MYDHKAIDKKWQRYWEEKETYKTPDSPENKQYVLDMFPYPSGAGLHVGHPEGYTATDIMSRFLRMNGSGVLHPMGWDAFGLPAENYAIKQGVPPDVTTSNNIDRFREQIKSIGLSYDWSREINTSSPEYYKWTQWLFLKLYDRGLAYKKEAYVNWCPSCQTVLANEQVVSGECERCGSKVEQKLLSQWFLKITDYADRLLSDLAKVDWPEPIVAMQKNWIGRSEGALIDFELSPASVNNFVLLHGYSGSPDKHIFPWLKAELQSRGYSVSAPALPNSEEPVVSDQVRALMESAEFDEDTVLVGHSLGGVVALKALETLKKPVKKTVLLCSYMENDFLNDEPFDERTFDWQFDFEKIRKNAGEVIIMRDDTDNIVPADQADKLAKMLGGTIVDFKAGKPHAWSERESEVLKQAIGNIRVFTTRPDTLYGATYLVMAPEHPLVEKITVFEQRDKVIDYVNKTKAKSELQRTALEKDKIGVFTGSYAINPATGEKIPVWIADYVLTNYGTGAIMAVPAHDERDFEFAKKYSLPVKQVIEPCFIQKLSPGKVREDLPFVEREAIVAIVRNPKDNTLLSLKWNEVEWTTFITGGIEADQTAEEAARREVAEETGYKNLKLIKALDYRVHGKFYHVPKGENRFAHFHAFLFELIDSATPDAVSEKELERHEAVWLSEPEALRQITAESQLYAFRALKGDGSLYTGEGILSNSGKFEGYDSEQARHKIAAEFGQEKVQYKLRDWLVSRQRYWGAPIPIVYDPEGKPHPIPAEHLPWKLPTDVEFKPTGQSPLVYSKEFVERTEKIFGQGWRPEYDTMDTFVDSSWYFLRFADPHNEQEFASKDEIKKWLPVDLYLGGAEHAVLHLLYARFFTKVLYDEEFLEFEEPFLKLRNQGLILGPDGEKMSKSRGNVINPDEVIAQYGADAFRMYEMFMGPLMDAKPWSTQGIVGLSRFLDKVMNLSEKIVESESAGTIHKLAKKVTEDIRLLKFNTAIAGFMEFVNENKQLNQSDWKIFLKLLAPFAPHLTEELWQKLGNSESIHRQAWPKYDESRIQESKVDIVIQVLGKVRAAINMPKGSSEEDVRNAALNDPNVQKHLEGKEVIKHVFVPDKLINFVVK